MLPTHARRDDETGDLRRFIARLQEVTDLLLASTDRWPEIFDLERAPEPFVDAILADLGNPFGFLLDLAAKRRLAGALVQMYRLKGTKVGIQRALRFFLEIESRRRLQRRGWCSASHCSASTGSWVHQRDGGAMHSISR